MPIAHGGCVYTTDIGKPYRPGVHPPPHQSQWLNIDPVDLLPGLEFATFHCDLTTFSVIVKKISLALQRLPCEMYIL